MITVILHVFLYLWLGTWPPRNDISWSPLLAGSSHGTKFQPVAWAPLSWLCVDLVAGALWPPWATEWLMGSQPQNRRSLEAYTEEPTALPECLRVNLLHLVMDTEMLGSVLFSPEQIVCHAFVEPISREPVLFFLNGLPQLRSFYLALFFFFFFSSFLFPPIFPFLSFLLCKFQVSW